MALVCLAGLPVLAASPAGADNGSDEMEFFAKLNELRGSRSVRPLAYRGDLANVARAWSSRMAEAGAISHNPSLAKQAPPDWDKLGENVGTGADVQGLHEAFVNSPLHYRNMVDASFDSVGVGVVRDGTGTIFVTVNFMTTRAAAPRAAPATTPPTTARPAAPQRRAAVPITAAPARLAPAPQVALQAAPPAAPAPPPPPRWTCDQWGSSWRSGGGWCRWVA